MYIYIYIQQSVHESEEIDKLTNDREGEYIGMPKREKRSYEAIQSGVSDSQVSFIFNLRFVKSSLYKMNRIRVGSTKSSNLPRILSCNFYFPLMQKKNFRLPNVP